MGVAIDHAWVHTGSAGGITHGWKKSLLKTHKFVDIFFLYETTKYMAYFLHESSY